MEEFNQITEELSALLEEFSSVLPEEFTTELEAKSDELANRLAAHLLNVETASAKEEDMYTANSQEENDLLVKTIEDTLDLLPNEEEDPSVVLSEFEMLVGELIELTVEYMLTFETAFEKEEVV